MTVIEVQFGPKDEDTVEVAAPNEQAPGTWRLSSLVFRDDAGGMAWIDWNPALADLHDGNAWKGHVYFTHGYYPETTQTSETCWLATLGAAEAWCEGRLAELAREDGRA